MGLQLRTHLAGIGFGVVDLHVDGAGDLLRQVREAHDQAGEAQAPARETSGLHADDAPSAVRRRRSASEAYGRARDESGDAQVLPEQIGFGGGRRGAVCPAGVIGIVDAVYLPVAVRRRRRCRGLGGPARRGILVVSGERTIAILIGSDRNGDPVEIVDHVLDLGLGDHFLAFEDAAQQQPDDDQNDRDFDQGETGLGRIPVLGNGRTHTVPNTTPA